MTVKFNVKRPGSGGTCAFSPITWKAGAVTFCELEASLVYTEFQASQGYIVYKPESSSGLKREKKIVWGVALW